ncbi:replicase polyprotein [Acrasis kona]|uniref:Replicase polyprotein n=1 Tax=Acrasis kona TaxID=1008807 RepID=A0AAW2Z7I3_9EUKA
MKRRILEDDDEEPSPKKLKYTSTAPTIDLDCILNICTYSEPLDIFVGISRVCKQWNNVLGMSGFWYLLYHNFFKLQQSDGINHEPQDNNENLWRSRFKMRYESCVFLDPDRAIQQSRAKLGQLCETKIKWTQVKQIAKELNHLSYKHFALKEIKNHMSMIVTKIEPGSSFDWFLERPHSLFLLNFPKAFYDNSQSLSEVSIVLYGPTLNEITVVMKIDLDASYVQLKYKLKCADENVEVSEDYNEKDIFLIYNEEEDRGRKEVKIDKKSIHKLIRNLFGSDYKITQPIKVLDDSDSDHDDDDQDHFVQDHFLFLRILIKLFSSKPIQSLDYDEESKPQVFANLLTRVNDALDVLQTNDAETLFEDDEADEQDDPLTAEDISFIVPDTEPTVVKQKSKNTSTTIVDDDSDSEGSISVDDEDEEVDAKPNATEIISDEEELTDQDNGDMEDEFDVSGDESDTKALVVTESVESDNEGYSDQQREDDSDNGREESEEEGINFDDSE